LREADILDAVLIAADLTNADMRGVRSRWTDLIRAKIKGLKHDEELRDLISR